MISILTLLLQAAPAPAAVAPWTVTTRPKTDPAITSTVTGASSADGGAKLVVRCDAGKAKVVSVQLFSRTSLENIPEYPTESAIRLPNWRCTSNRQRCWRARL